MTSSVNAATAASGGAAGAGSSQVPPAAGAVPDKQAFLKLLVAQIRHQDPLNPADGIQFVTQLAQFTELEQMMELRSDVSDIRDVLAPAAENSPENGDAATESKEA